MEELAIREAKNFHRRVLLAPGQKKTSSTSILARLNHTITESLSVFFVPQNLAHEKGDLRNSITLLCLHVVCLSKRGPEMPRHDPSGEENKDFFSFERPFVLRRNSLERPNKSRIFATAPVLNV